MSRSHSGTLKFLCTASLVPEPVCRHALSPVQLIPVHFPLGSPRQNGWHLIKGSPTGPGVFRALLLLSIEVLKGLTTSAPCSPPIYPSPLGSSSLPCWLTAPAHVSYSPDSVCLGGRNSPISHPLNSHCWLLAPSELGYKDYPHSQVSPVFTTTKGN